MSDLAAVLDDAAAFVRRFVVLTGEQADTLALWAMHTYALDAADCTPYLHASSAEKRSGKTRLIEVAALLVREPLQSANISDAALFRVVDDRHPTVLLDEVDAVFAAREREELRGLLCAGYRRGAPAMRMGGSSMTTLQTFDAFAPKLLAGIGELPDTLADRCVRIRLKRRASNEQIDRFRVRDADQDADPIRVNLEQCAAFHLAELQGARPELPDELSDRAQDIWEPLIAIADLAGDRWPERARTAARALSADIEADDDSLGVRLLADAHAAFEGHDRLTTEALLTALQADDEAPWADLRGTPLNARRLSRLLRPYEIRSRSIRLADDATAKGYLRDQFEDAWNRLLPSSGAPIRHTVTSSMDTGETVISDPSHEPLVPDRETGSNPHEHTVVPLVPDRNPVRGEIGGQEPDPTLLAEAERIIAEHGSNGVRRMLSRSEVRHLVERDRNAAVCGLLVADMSPDRLGPAPKCSNCARLRPAAVWGDA
jgi:Protein of unknown function (DUF3631)